MIVRSGEKVFLRADKLLCVSLMLLLFAVSTANASPTVAHQDAILFTSLRPAYTSASISRTISNNIVEPDNAELANLGAEFLQPPASSATLSNSVKPLPAIPATMLMVLTGFICISLVRDRRVWLSALAGLLYIGQAGVHAIPELAMHLGHRKHNIQQQSSYLYSYRVENSSRLRSDIEGTRYTGLLHHLAGIPGDTISFLQPRLSFLGKQVSETTKMSSLRKQEHELRAISSSYGLEPSPSCSVPITEQFIYFSPTFIFDHLPHGPPEWA